MRAPRAILLMAVAACTDHASAVPGPACGDGILQVGETCDNGELNTDEAADTCRTTCQLAACGDGVVDEGERCDEGEANSDTVRDACRTDCRLAACGDGIVDTAEACDDGDDIGNHDCPNDCSLSWSEKVAGSTAGGLAIDSDGRPVVVGTVIGEGGSLDAWVGRFNTDGGVRWTRTYDGMAGGSDWGTGVAVDGAGNVVIAVTETIGPDDADAAVVKYDPSGALLWARKYDRLGQWDTASRIAVDATGNVLVVGYETTIPGNTNVWVRKYDPEGAIAWTEAHDGGALDLDEGRSVAVDSDGNVLVAGVETDLAGNHAWLRKFGPDGATIWTQTYSGGFGSLTIATGVAVDSGANIMVSGIEVSSGRHDIWARKYDSEGRLMWTREYDGPGHGEDWSWDADADTDGNLLMTGWETVGDGTADVWMSKYDPDGDLLWLRTYDAGSGDHDDDRGRGIRSDADGNVWVLGDFTPTTHGLWLARYLP